MRVPGRGDDRPLPVAELGDRLADTFLDVWEHPRTGPALEALLRSALTGPLDGLPEAARRPG